MLELEIKTIGFELSDLYPMQSKLKHLNDIITAITRVFTISLMILLVWISHVWSEQKLSLNNYNISIIGSSILSSQYYKKYLKLH